MLEMIAFIIIFIIFDKIADTVRHAIFRKSVKGLKKSVKGLKKLERIHDIIFETDNDEIKNSDRKSKRDRIFEEIGIRFDRKADDEY